jgi:hypothetical protein
MTARVIRDDDDPRELYRWALAGLIMLTAHLALVATFMLLRKPDALPAGAPVVLVDLAPAPSAPTEQPLDLPPVVENVPTPPQPVEQEVQPTPPEPEAADPARAPSGSAARAGAGAAASGSGRRGGAADAAGKAGRREGRAAQAA